MKLFLSFNSSSNFKLVPDGRGCCFQCPRGDFDDGSCVPVDGRQAVWRHLLAYRYDNIIVVEYDDIYREFHAERMNPFTGLYEQAFPLPDAFLALVSLVGVVGLWKMRDWGFLSMLLAAGAAFFLGLEDLLYDLQHNMFSPFNTAAAIELAIVLVIMALGPAMTALLWKHRREFLQ